MNTFSNTQQKSSRKEHAQGLVEFALILPLLLFIIFGLIEFGRLLATYSQITTASRDAVRYGAAAGDVGGGLPHYLDCVGIREAAKKHGILSAITDDNITISYDTGPGTAVVALSCPTTEQLPLGSRILVDVSATFEPIVPLGGILQTMTINSSSVRTILKNVEVQGTPASGGGFPEVYFSIDEDSVSENVGNYTLQVELSVPTTSETYVPFTVSGTSSYYTDFSVAADSIMDNGGQISGRFHIPAGQTAANVVIAISNDSIDEYDETVVLTLDKPTNATVGDPHVFQLTIVDDDNAPTVNFSSTGQSVNEDATGLTVSVIMNSVSGKNVTVPFTLGGSATAGEDYTVDVNSVTIPAGSLNANIPVSLIDDPMDEDDENIIFYLGDPINGVKGNPNTHTATIFDNDLPPVVTFAISSQIAGENIGNTFVVVELSAPSSKVVTVPFSMSGTALQPSDYSLDPANSLTIPAGETSGNIVVTLINDGITEPAENAIFTMGTPTNGSKGTPSVHTLTITDLVTQPTVSFEVATGEPKAENIGSFVVRVILSNAWDKTVTIPFSVDGTSTATQSVDYAITGNSLSVLPGYSFAEINITVIDDNIDESDLETIVLNLGTPTNATLGEITTHTASIEDNEALPIASIAIHPSYPDSNPESTTSVLILITLSNPSSRDVTVPFTVSGTATRGTDCANPSPGVDYCLVPDNGQVVIPAGVLNANITLTIVDDVERGENNETVQITLGSPDFAQLNQASSIETYTIEDNDECPTLGTLSTPGKGEQKLSVEVINSENAIFEIDRVEISWYYKNASSPKLDYIYVQDDPNKMIWDGLETPIFITPSGSLVGDMAWREIPSTSSKMLNFFFTKELSVSQEADYITVYFTDGCSATKDRR